MTGPASGNTLTFLGGAGTVTGSKYLVQLGRTRLLIDCGLFQGYKHLRERNWTELPVAAQTIDAVLLTHAHLDHSGWLPALVKRGFRGPIFSTAATRDLAAILLPDSGWLQEEEACYAAKRGYSKHDPPMPLYTRPEAERALEFFRPERAREEFAPAKGVRARFIPAGHILGAASVRLEWAGGSLLVSGDLGRDDDSLMKPPDPPPAAKTVLLESTYGDRRHDPEPPETTLGAVINCTAARGGVVIIPAFAVGRAQTLLYLLWRLKRRRAIPDLPVYLNSPMAIDATELLTKHPRQHRLTAEECAATCRSAAMVRDAEASKALNRLDRPAILIAASGMATGGRVLHHLKAYGPDAKNTILLAGYQAGGTRGADLAAGARSLRVHGERVAINAEVVTMHSLSAHADAAGLEGWAASLPEPPAALWLVHSEPAAAEALRRRVAERTGWTARIAEPGATVPL